MVQDVHGRRLERVPLEPLDDAERAALHQMRDALAIWLAPGRRAAIVAMLARLANHRSKDRSAGEWQMLFEDYCDDLAAFSDAHVAEAIKEHRQHNTFFPSISELRTRCMELRQRDQWRLERTEKLLRDAA